MGTIRASAIVDRVHGLLRDPSGVQWTTTELLRFLSDAQRAAVEIRPDINPKRVVMQMESGSRQDIPHNGTAYIHSDPNKGTPSHQDYVALSAFSLIECVRNMGADGATAGRAIRVVQRDVLDTSRPNWHSESHENAGVTSVNQVRSYVYDIRARSWFYVWPAQVDDGANDPHYVEVIYSGVPMEITAADTPIELDDVYQTVLLNYVLHRAYSMQINTSASERYPQMAASYYQLFQAELTGGKVSEMQLDPLHQSEMTARIT